ncbi:MAG: hypothetical protein LBK61_12620 [Spirochaetaceae bacterium]|jgi:DNA-binding LytR/AlgR family response regulator|nr:hypothetical protein [Spirochaetaceae bacterium]
MNKKFLFTGMAVLLSASLFFLGCPTDSDDDDSADDSKDTVPTVVSNDLDLTSRVIAPKTGESLVTTAIDATEYSSGTIAWKNNDGTAFGGTAFESSTVYKAVVLLTAKETYTFTDFAGTFTHTGGTVAAGTNTGATLEVTITFQQTGLPTIGITTTGFDALIPVTLPTALTSPENIKTTADHLQIPGNDATGIYSVASNEITAFRAAGGKAVTWDNSGSGASAFWKDATLTNVRVDVTLTPSGGGAADNAYLLVWDGVGTYEVVKTGFIGLYIGSPMTGEDGLNKVQSLTFGATAAGTYTAAIAIKKVSGTDGTVEQTLAEQTVVFTVAMPTIGISTTGYNALTAVTLPTALNSIKTTHTDQQIPGNDATKIYSVATNEIAGFRTAGGVAVTWDNSSASAGTVWKDATLTNVRVDVALTATGGTAADAYLLVWDGVGTYEVVKTGFIGLYIGNAMTGEDGLQKVQSLTFGATAAGTYTVDFAIKKVDGTDGAVIQTLAEQTLVFTVTGA